MGISKQKREAVYAKYDGHCADCGEKIAYKDMQVDHFKPLRDYNDGDCGCDASLWMLRTSITYAKSLLLSRALRRKLRILLLTI